jgi:hypothetical protein
MSNEERRATRKDLLARIFAADKQQRELMAAREKNVHANDGREAEDVGRRLGRLVREYIGHGGDRHELPGAKPASISMAEAIAMAATSKTRRRW